jgi:hypothetical protein
MYALMIQEDIYSDHCKKNEYKIMGDICLCKI